MDFTQQPPRHGRDLPPEERRDIQLTLPGTMTLRAVDRQRQLCQRVGLVHRPRDRIAQRLRDLFHPDGTSLGIESLFHATSKHHKTRAARIGFVLQRQQVRKLRHRKSSCQPSMLRAMPPVDADGTIANSTDGLTVSSTNALQSGQFSNATRLPPNVLFRSSSSAASDWPTVMAARWLRRGAPPSARQSRTSTQSVGPSRSPRSQS